MKGHFHAIPNDDDIEGNYCYMTYTKLLLLIKA